MQKAAGDKTSGLGVGGDGEEGEREEENTEEEDNEELAPRLIGVEGAEYVHTLLSFPRKRESRFSFFLSIGLNHLSRDTLDCRVAKRSSQ